MSATQLDPFPWGGPTKQALMHAGSMREAYIVTAYPGAGGFLSPVRSIQQLSVGLNLFQINWQDKNIIIHTNYGIYSVWSV